MLKTVIVLPDGTELSSGQGAQNAIQSTSIIECVNSGAELAIGSTCSNSVEVKIFTPDGALSIQAGTEMVVYREDERGIRSKVGIFIAETPTRTTANTLKVLGYDRVSKLDKDLTAWLSGLSWDSYDINDFAEMVCAECGVPYKPNLSPAVPSMDDYAIGQFTKSAVTGRQIMKWLGEICCSFCRADADGNIEFAWYTPNDIDIKPSGDIYYFQNGLTYEDYVVAPVDTVNLRLADSEDGALWPADPNYDGFPENPNRYIITGNAILTRVIDQGTDEALTSILQRLRNVTYTPCKITVPASMNIHAGDIIRVTDKNGVTFTTYVMTKTQEGQKDTIECTGSARRDSSSATNNKSTTEKIEDMLNSMTANELFNKLTENGKVQGIYKVDNFWIINAAVISTGILRSSDGGVYIDLDTGIGNLARGVSAKLSLWDEDAAGFTRTLDEVVDEFVTEELKKMQLSTIRDYAAQFFGYNAHGEGVKIAVFKFRKTSAQPVASISFEWADGARSHKTARCLSEENGEIWEIDPMEWL